MIFQSEDQVQLFMKQGDFQSCVNGTVELPELEIQLPPRDDAAEFDDTTRAPSFTDDPRYCS